MIDYKKRYYKVVHGYGSEDVIEIDNVQDLEKAIYAFSTGKSVRLGDSFIKGTEIKSIKENWNRTMGYARGYKLDNDDWVEIKQKGVEKLYSGFLYEVSQKVEHLAKQNMTNFIGVDRKSLPQFINLIELQ
jgi:hypothetical protein